MWMRSRLRDRRFDLVQQLPAQASGQQAIQRLLVPAQTQPAEVLLQAELRAVEAGL